VLLNSSENLKKDLLIFGGINSPENVLLNDVWLFNFQGINLRSNLHDLSGTVIKKVDCGGDIPSARRGHHSITIDNSLYVIGGLSADSEENTSLIFSLNYGIFDC
jgi:hypothetical protein